jgi:putative ABC transport system permease protein
VRLGVSWLDVKLGIRMLVRYPGLSFAAGLAIAVVVVCGAAAGIFDAVVNGTLPFDEGDRVVAIENWDTRQNRPAAHTLNDFLAWREMTTLQDVGAYRLVKRNVAAVGLPAEPARIAEISTSSFRIANVAPVLGRHLTADDEAPGAAPVIVIGHDEWMRRFARDPHVLGRTLQVGETASTVVGVMPEGFGFPVNERYWIPLRVEPSDYAHEQRPSSMPYKDMPHGVIHVFGRLADGADVAAAQAEIALIGQRAAIASPATHAYIRPRVLPYTRWFFDEQHDGEIFLVQGVVALLLGVVGANVAVLVYARTAARRIEVAVRSALGASRMRIVGQLFAEGLVLSLAAAALGLVLAAILRSELTGLIPWHLAPFWVDTTVTSGTVLTYVLALAVFGGVIVGVIPALQVTSRRAQSSLQHAASSTSAWKIGRTYGALIVTQVALAVAILPFAVSSTWTSVREAFTDPGFAAGEFLTARLEVEGDFRNRRAELVRRLESEPGVSRVILLSAVPGSEPKERIEIEGNGTAREVRVGTIGIGFVEAFDIAVLSGRPFDAADVQPFSRHAIVNRTFAEKIIGGNALGRRIRSVASPESAAAPWLEIVGVVEDFPAAPARSTAADARLYQLVAPEDNRLTLLALRVNNGAPAAFASRLREIATEVHSSLMLRDLRPMDTALRQQRIGLQLGAWVSGFITASLLLLSATGLYALMAFTVTQRRREIAIRVALGANAGNLLRGVFSRALWQLAAGIAVGVVLAALVDVEGGGELTGGAGLWMLFPVAAFVLAVGLVAVAGPARRGLSIEPSETLKEG